MSTAFPQTRSSKVHPALYQPSGALRWISDRFFRHIDLDARWTEAVREAAERGTVVYVMRSLSVLDYLCLDYLTKTHHLPRIQFVNDLGHWMKEPFGRGSRKRSREELGEEEVALGRTLEQHGSALLFLRRPPRLGHPSRKGEAMEADLIRGLIEAQRRTQWPILLVPQTFMWGKLAGQQEPGSLDFLLGPVEWPGRVRELVRFALNYRNALLRTGDPFDLKHFLDQNPELSDAEAADKVRFALMRRMERERTLVVGPNKKTPNRLREEIIRSPRLRKQVDAIISATGRSLESVEDEVDRELRKLCATPDDITLRILHRLLDRVWTKIYDGIDVDQEGLARVREAARHGPLILLPSHKSYVDFLVLSDVFYIHQLSPPLVAAGENLSFWPLGPIFRHGGAFFIKRTFKGNRLYSSIVDTYMRRLLLDGHHIELFIEGGRSRTGKLLPPKFGLLSMLVDACLALKDKPIHFVPISIGYELLVEQQSYMQELAGGDKQAENIGGLLNKTPEVLRSRYGRLYIQFGEVMPFTQLVEDALGADAAKASRLKELNLEDRRNLVQRIGHRSTYEINRVTVVTPAALISTCFLVHRRRGVSRAQLAELATLLRDVLRQLGARLAPTIDNVGPINLRALEEAVSLLRDGKLITQHGEGKDAVYTVPDERRVALEYYKNNIIHFFVARALISAALLVREDERAVSEHALRERVRKISRLFKYEFMYRADTDFDEIFDDALKDMLDAGELERFVDRVRPTDDLGHRVSIYAAMVSSYFEAYSLAGRAVQDLPSEGISRKEWFKRTLALGHRLFLSGEIEDREAISKHKLETALQALRDFNIVQFGNKGNVMPLPQSAESIAAWLEQLKAYLK
ncbi:MAG: Glycerol-3-phosphate acyltransferase [Myxococcaceae bacterium]|nr:Glycerol-3-phosphate acyltransferase [Myxococcaceae bacterium]